ncbi:MAG: PEGA domain-containing protein [Deltaproteobacteria bacterium]|nr:PEGA domain-containing protein [Deltaproteobacteria bacterium]
MDTKSLLAGLSLLTAGCATIFSGTSQNVTVQSTPAGARARVMIDGAVANEIATPAVVKLAKGQKVTIEVSAEGYMPARIDLEKSINGWYWVDVFTLNLVGIAVDLGTGAWANYDDQVFVTLTKVPVGNEEGRSPAVYVAVDLKNANTGRWERGLLPLQPAQAGP